MNLKHIHVELFEHHQYWHDEALHKISCTHVQKISANHFHQNNGQFGPNLKMNAGTF